MLSVEDGITLRFREITIAAERAPQTQAHGTIVKAVNYNTSIEP